VLGRIIRGIADERLRIDDEPWRSTGAKNIPRVQVCRQQHYPDGPYMPKDRVEEYARQWDAAAKQQHVLDVALAWSVINNHFDVADFLLDHGADINTTWSSHEPASILHELVFHANYPAMQFLIDAAST
jgi:Ankyrin repeats (many copies)